MSLFNYLTRTQVLKLQEGQFFQNLLVNSLDQTKLLIQLIEKLHKINPYYLITIFNYDL